MTSSGATERLRPDREGNRACLKRAPISLGVLAIVLFCVSLSGLYAQGSAGSGGKIEPRYLIDVPTAGMLERGSFAVDLEFYQQGGVLLGFSVGLLDHLSLGASFGGTNLIGGGTAAFNDAPGVNVKIRVVDEHVIVPALALGFDSQGHDGYIKSLSRYVIKSPGLYAVLSKNYGVLGFLSIHGGANYSLERTDGNKNINLFLGIEKTLGAFVSVVAEYNLGSNDTGTNAIGKGNGYLNAALKWSLGGGLTLAVNLKDLAHNGNEIDFANRTFKIEFIRPF